MIRVSAGILWRDGQVLICQRGGEGPFAGKWEFPGGKQQEGESAEEALVRELAEELDITVRGADLRRVEMLSHHYPGGPQVELHFFQVLCFANEPRNLAFRSIRWVAAPEAAQYDFLEADRGLLARLATGTLLEKA